MLQTLSRSTATTVVLAADTVASVVLVPEAQSPLCGLSLRGPVTAVVLASEARLPLWCLTFGSQAFLNHYHAVGCCRRKTNIIR